MHSYAGMQRRALPSATTTTPPRVADEHRRRGRCNMRRWRGRSLLILLLPTPASMDLTYSRCRIHLDQSQNGSNGPPADCPPTPADIQAPVNSSPPPPPQCWRACACGELLSPSRRCPSTASSPSNKPAGPPYFCELVFSLVERGRHSFS